ncbi:MFS transporter [Kibdelosporangium aridum]|uniref:Predicted arabinose efflux permease, MFS family n=1 Tax=Kibdelosporangium aridum TaxID=2030 RepID=A0A1W2CSU8_KIBAR|nr:MFS transporter [Kibdelosporangium aridum]SMC88293.1 Predicted arabinose efflux permease, MFS family [Kibdelosporangium aridum]
MLQPYRELAAVPRVPGLLTWATLGRLHMTGTPLAMSFLIAGWTGSYAIAGVIGAALLVGLGVSGPMRGRAADRRGAAGLIVFTGVCYGIGMTVLAFLPTWLPSSWWPLMALAAFTVGLFNPPVIPVGRAIWPRLLSGSALNSVYTVDATLTELMYAVGPLLAAALVAAVNPELSIVISGALATIGALGFARMLTLAGLGGPVPTIHHAKPRRAGLFNVPGVVASLMLSFFLVAALLMVDMTIVAWARNVNLPILAGVLGAVWAVGSGIGGLIAGGLTGTPRLTRRVVLNLVGVAALVPVLPPVFDPASPWLIGVVLLLGGAAIAPAAAAANARLGELAPEERRTEAYGWLSSASTAGFALALPTSGFLLDHGGPSYAAAGAVVLVALGVVLAMRIPAAKPVPVLS